MFQRKENMDKRKAGRSNGHYYLASGRYHGIRGGTAAGESYCISYIDATATASPLTWTTSKRYITMADGR